MPRCAAPQSHSWAGASRQQQVTQVSDLQHTHSMAGAGLSHTEFPLESATLPSIATGTWCDERDRALTHPLGQVRVEGLGQDLPWPCCTACDLPAATARSPTSPS